MSDDVQSHPDVLKYRKYLQVSGTGLLAIGFLMALALIGTLRS
jgi:hypothetical protein